MRTTLSLLCLIAACDSAPEIDASDPVSDGGETGKADGFVLPSNTVPEPSFELSPEFLAYAFPSQIQPDWQFSEYDTAQAVTTEAELADLAGGYSVRCGGANAEERLLVINELNVDFYDESNRHTVVMALNVTGDVGYTTFTAVNNGHYDRVVAFVQDLLSLGYGRHSNVDFSTVEGYASTSFFSRYRSAANPWAAQVDGEEEKDYFAGLLLMYAVASTGSFIKVVPGELPPSLLEGIIPINRHFFPTIATWGSGVDEGTYTFATATHDWRLKRQANGLPIVSLEGLESRAICVADSKLRDPVPLSSAYEMRDRYLY